MYHNKLRIFTLAFACALLTGCAGQGNPVETTTSPQTAPAIQTTETQPPYVLPTRYTGDWETQEGRLVLHADAAVNAPQGTVLPMATVRKRPFDQSDVDLLVDVFAQGAELHYLGADPQRQNEVLSKPAIEGQGDFCPFGAQFERDGQRWNIYMMTYNGPEGPWSWSHVTVNRDDVYRNGCSPEGVTQTPPDQEAAQAQVEALLEKLGRTDMVFNDAQIQDDGALRLGYAPSVLGFAEPSSVAYAIMEDGTYRFCGYNDTVGADSEHPDTVSWHQEYMEFIFGTEGLYKFSWEEPATEPQVITEAAELLPFEEIKAIADTLLPEVCGILKGRTLTEIDQINGFDTRMTVNITDVTLNLMRVRDKGSLEGTILPVWDFWGEKRWEAQNPADAHYMSGETKREVVLTINAVTGNVVDRELGY